MSASRKAYGRQRARDSASSLSASLLHTCSCRICILASVCQDRTGHAGLCVGRVPVSARQLRIREAHRQPTEAREVPSRRIRDRPAYAPHQIGGLGPAHAVLQRGRGRQNSRRSSAASPAAATVTAHARRGRERIHDASDDLPTSMGTLLVSGAGPGVKQGCPGRIGPLASPALADVALDTGV